MPWLPTPRRWRCSSLGLCDWAGTVVIRFFGTLSALLAAATVYATAMIYRSLETVAEWSNGWTIGSYLSLGLAGGAIWSNAVVHLFGAAHPAIAALAFLALLSVAVAWVVKFRYWRFIDNALPRATRESATGLRRFGTVRSFEGPHTEQNYLLKEMGYQVARKHALKLRRYALIAAFALPLALSALALLTGEPFAIVATIFAAISVVIGLLFERWLFFAEATHGIPFLGLRKSSRKNHTPLAMASRGQEISPLFQRGAGGFSQFRSSMADVEQTLW